MVALRIFKEIVLMGQRLRWIARVQSCQNVSFALFFIPPSFYRIILSPSSSWTQFYTTNKPSILLLLFFIISSKGLGENMISLLSVCVKALVPFLAGRTKANKKKRK